MAPGLEQEKKINTRLAVGVGLFGVASIGAFYVLFFLMMFLRPGLLFRFLPVPATTSAAVSDGSRLWLLQERPDMSDLSPREKRPPRTIYQMLPVEGTALGRAVEIPSYDRAVPTGQGVVFLSEEVYRTYAGGRMTEQWNTAIGAEPRGAMTPQGLVVLSTLESGASLHLVSGGTATAIPLPAEYLAKAQDDDCRCCTRLLWHRDRLFLFWKADDALAWTSWDGAAWSAVHRTGPAADGYDVLSDGSTLSLFRRTGEGRERQLSVAAIAGETAAEPVVLPITGTFDEWDVNVVQGKVRLFTQRSLTQTIATLEQGRLTGPVTITTGLFPANLFGVGAVMAAVMNGVMLLLVLAVSAVVNKYKRRTGEREGRTYEFASLFRRFLAHLIDTLVLVLPPALLALRFVPFDTFPENPFAVMFGMLFAMLSLLVATFLYFSLLEGLAGRTLGKRLCGIRVLKADFTPCTLGAAFLRNLLRIVDMFFYYLPAAVAIAATVKWQRLGDLAAETVVVRDR